MAYNLKMYFDEAKISDLPEWFDKIILRHPDIEDYRPRFHQVTGLNLPFIHSRSALFDEQGTGKTLPAQTMMIYHAAVGNKALAMMPPTLLHQFRKSFYETFEGIDEYIKIDTYHGSIPQREKMAKGWLVEPPQIILTTPDCFRAEFKIFDQFEVNVLVCDECKYWSNSETKIATAIEWYMGEYGSRILFGMNGTPAKNNLADLYGYIRLLTPWVYRNKRDFYAQHVNEIMVPTRFRKNGQLVEKEVRVIDSFKNTGVLKKNIMLQARRVEKKDVLELPKKLIIPREFKLSPKHNKAYQHFCTAKFMEFDDGTAISGEQTATMRQIARQAIMQPDILHIDEESEVMSQIEELFDELDVDNNKIMIGAFYRETIERIAAKFAKYNPAVIYGGQTRSKNTKGEIKFKEDDTCRIVVMNYISGGVGLNFQKSHYSISAEPTTVPGDFDQWTDRQHRSGQKCEVTCYVLIPKNTIFVRDVQKMRRKRIVNDSVMSARDLRAELLGE